MIGMKDTLTSRAIIIRFLTFFAFGPLCFSISAFYSIFNPDSALGM